jgi:hypothetical protein
MTKLIVAFRNFANVPKNRSRNTVINIYFENLPKHKWVLWSGFRILDIKQVGVQYITGLEYKICWFTVHNNLTRILNMLVYSIYQID